MTDYWRFGNFLSTMIFAIGLITEQGRALCADRLNQKFRPRRISKANGGASISDFKLPCEDFSSLDLDLPL
jgi:hypothetical protein